MEDAAGRIKELKLQMAATDQDVKAAAAPSVHEAAWATILAEAEGTGQHAQLAQMAEAIQVAGRQHSRLGPDGGKGCAACWCGLRSLG